MHLRIRIAFSTEFLTRIDVVVVVVAKAAAAAVVSMPIFATVRAGM